MGLPMPIPRNVSALPPRSMKRACSRCHTDAVSAADVSSGEATTFLTDHYEGAVTEVVALTGGAWSRAFGFRLDDQSLVVRFGAWIEDFEADREAMSFAGPDLPVPRVLEIGEAFTGFYAISERRFGVFLEELEPAALRRVLPALLRTLDALRALPAQADGRWHDYLREVLVDRPGGRVSGWREKLTRSEDAESTFIEGRKVMEPLLDSCPELGHVLHLDLINRNVLADPEQGRIEAVFDWGCMTRGDFVYEIAWLHFWSPWYPGLTAVDWRAAALDHYRQTGVHVDDFDLRLRCYELHIGLRHLAYNAFVGDRETDTQLLVRRIHTLL